MVGEEIEMGRRLGKVAGGVGIRRLVGIGFTSFCTFLI